MSMPTNLAGGMYVFATEGNTSFGKLYLEGFFSQQAEAAIAVVGVITIVDNEIKGWKAYMGSSQARTEREVLEDVKKWGNKLDIKHARAYFPDFNPAMYDNGW